MAFIDELKDEVLYDTWREFYHERGMAVRFRLPLVGTEFFARHLKDPSDTEEIIALFKTEKLAEDVKTTEDEFQINEEVHKCIFKPICDKIKQETEPVCCPLVNVLMKAIDLKTGFTPKALPIAMERDVCKIGLGKMGNDDVVEAKGVF